MRRPVSKDGPKPRYLCRQRLRRLAAKVDDPGRVDRRGPGGVDRQGGEAEPALDRAAAEAERLDVAQGDQPEPPPPDSPADEQQVVGQPVAVEPPLQRRGSGEQRQRRQKRRGERAASRTRPRSRAAPAAGWRRCCAGYGASTPSPARAAAAGEAAPPRPAPPRPRFAWRRAPRSDGRRGRCRRRGSGRPGPTSRTGPAPALRSLRRAAPCGARSPPRLRVNSPRSRRRRSPSSESRKP